MAAKKSVYILGKKYNVTFYTKTELGGLYGQSNRYHGFIQVSSDTSPAQMEDTLIHEVLHMISEDMAIGLKEADITRLACGLYSAGVRIPLKKARS